MSRPTSVIDTCCLINLCAVDRPLDLLLREVPPRLVVARAVEREEISVRPRPDAAAGERRRVDLAPLFGAGVLDRCDVETDAERDLYVRLATALDDGEATSLAIAASRGCILATDDRPARRLAVTLQVPVLTTPQVVRRWAEAVELPGTDLARAISLIETLARFQPGRDLPDCDWWMRR